MDYTVSKLSWSSSIKNYFLKASQHTKHNHRVYVLSWGIYSQVCLLVLDKAHTITLFWVHPQKLRGGGMSHKERVAFGVMKNEGTEGGKVNSQGHVSLIDSIPRDCGRIRDRQAASIGKIWNFKIQKGRFLGQCQPGTTDWSSDRKALFGSATGLTNFPWCLPKTAHLGCPALLLWEQKWVIKHPKTWILSLSVLINKISKITPTLQYLCKLMRFHEKHSL